MSSKIARRAVMLLIACMLVVGGFFIGTSSISRSIAGAALGVAPEALQTAPANQAHPLADVEEVYSNIYKQVTPSVVSINVVARSSGATGNDPFQQGGGLLEGTGTGFVIDTQGHIVTNNHVVEGATRIEVNFFDGTIVKGEVVGLDPDSDLAVIKVDLPVSELHPVTFGNSDTLFVGQSVVAIGSPFGQKWTMTTGIISATDRTITGLTNYQIGSVIQTDAAINPGNSGGPLLDLNGNIVGVNSQIVSRSNSSSGIGFSIPSNLVRRVAATLIDKGAVSYSYLGLSSYPNDVDLAIMQALNLPDNARGVVVMGTQPGSPAAQAGLRNAGQMTTIDSLTVPSSADIITAIDGQPVTGFNALITYLTNNTQPGQQITLTVLRSGKTLQLPLTLGERPHTDQ